MLIAKNISKNYNTLSVLNDISFEISENEIISIVGASGAGKSTLLQILGTLDHPSSGTILIDHTDPFQLSKNKLARFRNSSIGFIFQFHQLLPEFTALENAILPSLIRGDSKEKATLKARELFDFLNLRDRDHHKPNALSGGEQQRVAVARALINEPKIVFADEPSGNLDSKNAEELHQLFVDLRNNYGQTFVIVTHNEKLAQISDRRMMISDGKISFN